MFRHPLRGIFLLLSLAWIAAPLPAAAVLDIDEVQLTITIARSTISGGDLIRAQVRVIGTDLNNGTIALPSAPSTHIPLDDDGEDLVYTQNFATEAALNAALPTTGNYLLRVNSGNAQATIPYTRPTVPNPAISQPTNGVVAPGSIEVQFTRCSVCNLVGDSVDAVLEDDMEIVLDEEELDQNAESWVPQAMGGGDLILPEQSAFVVRITHAAARQANVTVTTDDDNNLLFTGTFVQSDEVDFETGFSPPSGQFCLAANFPGAPAGCHTLANPALQLFDTSGVFTVQVDGHDVDVDMDVGAGGQLTGTANADLDDSGVNETSGEIKGKLSGRDGEAKSKVSFPLVNEGLLAKLKASISDVLSLASNSRVRVQSASGSLGGMKIKEVIESTDTPLPDAPLGWLITYTLNPDGSISAAELELEGGRTFALTGTNKFNFSSNQSSVKLVSDPKGISVTLKKLGLDDAGNPAPMEITEGSLSYKALGQSGKAVLP